MRALRNDPDTSPLFVIFINHPLALEGMDARIANYRGANSTLYPRHIIVHVDGITSREKAAALVGKKASWSAPGKAKTTIIGKVAAAHGNSGAVRVIFERGLPGQALGTSCKID